MVGLLILKVGAELCWRVGAMAPKILKIFKYIYIYIIILMFLKFSLKNKSGPPSIWISSMMLLKKKIWSNSYRDNFIFCNSIFYCKMCYYIS